MLLLGLRCEAERPPGILILREPIQRMLARPKRWERDGFVFEAIADYDISARVLSRRVYRFYWTHYVFQPQIAEQISRLDLALGWGIMSDSALLDRVEISQKYRFAIMRPYAPLPVSPDEINRHYSNNHLIPASPEIDAALMELRRGDLVRIVGELVGVEFPERQWSWGPSSTTRDDDGCELIYVRSVALLDHS